MKRRLQGNFIIDFKPKPPKAIATFNAAGLREANPLVKADAILKQQPAKLDHAALDYCPVDVFDHGCELTFAKRQILYYRPLSASNLGSQNRTAMSRPRPMANSCRMRKS
ncbi:MAG: hypothetical protein EOP04_00250 [Proteobacteria bacterium]|nr:MAG: hypothetical protein EOP04_00250 [Pseudomonadota bacterium]